MSWIRQVEGRHICDVPTSRNAYSQRGSVWQCDTCAAYWKCESHKTWHQISDGRGQRIARREALKRGVK